MEGDAWYNAFVPRAVKPLGPSTHQATVRLPSTTVTFAILSSLP